MLKYADKQGRSIRGLSLTSLLSVLQISIFYSVSYSLYSDNPLFLAFLSNQ